MPDSAEEDSPLIYGLELQARALASAGTSDSTLIRFVVGTQSLKSDNQIHLLEYLEESHSLSKNIFRHPAGEIWNISASPKNSSLVMTCHSKATTDGQLDNGCTLFRFPIDVSNNLVDEDNISSQQLSTVGHFDVIDGGERLDVGRSAIWKPEDGDQVVNYAGNKIYLWDVERDTLISSFAIEDKNRSSKLGKISAIRWSPHSNCSTLGVVLGNMIIGKDIRCKSDGAGHAWTINAHSNQVRDLDFNPNAQYYVASCGDDCESRFWDIRQPATPAVSLLSHSHWIWSIRYNQFHDQLVLTCSSDARVVLTRVASLASQPFGHLLDVEDDESGSDDRSGDDLKPPTTVPGADEVVATFEEHEDSVYAAEWSASDPWMFASLSYDGRLVLNKVPKSEKLSILF